MAKKTHTRTLESKSAGVPKRNEDGTLAPGSTANPGGLPKWRREFVEAFGQRCAPLAEQVLYHTLSGLNAQTGEPDAEVTLDHQLSAAAEVLKYVVPKPKQELRIEGPGGGSPLSVLPLEDLIALGRGLKATPAKPEDAVP